MALAVTISNTDVAQDSFYVRGTIVASGSYATGGDTLSFASLGIPASVAPRDVFIHGIAGFVYSFSRGSTLANSLMLVHCNTAGGANAPLGEHTAASYAAGVSGDTITFLAIFDKLL